MHIHKKAKLAQTESTVSFHSCAVNISCCHKEKTLFTPKLSEHDLLNHCNTISICRWLSINRHDYLFCGTEDRCISQIVQNYSVGSPDQQALLQPALFSKSIVNTTGQKKFHAIDFFFDPALCSSSLSIVHQLCLYRAMLSDIITQFQPIVVLLILPSQSNTFILSDNDIYQNETHDHFNIQWNILDAATGPLSQYPFVLIVFLSRVQYNAHIPPSSMAQAALSAYTPLSNMPMLSSPHHVPVHREMWSNILEFTCQYILEPVITANNDNKIEARVCLTQPPPDLKDWSDAYKKDSDCNLLMNHLSTSEKPFSPEIISTVHRCF